MHTRVVVVGASIAGVTAADTLRAQGFDGEIILIGSDPHPPYARPPLSKGVLSGLEAPESVGLPALGADVDLRLGVTATALDQQARTVTLQDGDVLTYDAAVIASGARARSLAVPGQTGEYLMRSLDDAVALHDALLPGRRVIVVGGGFLGMEVASTCRTLGLEVTVVDRDPPLERLLGPVLAGSVVEMARAAGVTFQACLGNATLLGDDVVIGIEVDGQRMLADVVVVAVGDLPNTRWLAGSGIELAQSSGGVLVDERCRVSDRIVAAGDVAVMRSAPASTTGARSPHWTSAVEQGRTAALALLHGDDAKPLQSVPYFWTEGFGLEIKIAGSLGPLGEPTVLEGSLADRSALLQWSTGTAAAVNHRLPLVKLKRLAVPVVS